MLEGARRRHPRTASWWRSVACPGDVRDSIRPIVHRWLDKAARIAIARSRIAVRHSAAPDAVPHAAGDKPFTLTLSVRSNCLDNASCRISAVDLLESELAALF